jgi:hypothetical protein
MLTFIMRFSNLTQMFLKLLLGYRHTHRVIYNWTKFLNFRSISKCLGIRLPTCYKISTHKFVADIRNSQQHLDTDTKTFRPVRDYV